MIRKRDGGQLSPVAAVLALAATEEAASFVLLPMATAYLVPPPSPTEAACIGREDVLVLLRDDGLAVPLLKLGLPPLQFLNHSRSEMNPSIPIFDSGKDGLLEVKKGPDVKRSGSDCSPYGVQGSDQAGILASRELVLLVQHDRVEALAKKTSALAARHEKLHLDTVDLSA